MSTSGNGGSPAPCGACKFLRRRCENGCVFAPHFGSDQQAQFEAVHRVFGASNVSKMLQRIPLPELRRDAIFTITFEALARLADPIYGCVSHIMSLEQQVTSLQSELAIVQAQLTTFLATLPNQQQHHHHHQQHIISPQTSSTTYNNPSSSMSNPTNFFNDNQNNQNIKEKSFNGGCLNYPTTMLQNPKSLSSVQAIDALSISRYCSASSE